MSAAKPVDFHGLPAIRWRSPDGACAIATLQGAHIVSWTPAGGEECLFVSDRSPFEAGRPIRGGIPVCFPQFADRGPLAQHGFARALTWTFGGASEGQGEMRATFVLESSPATLALWPHPFRLELAAAIGGGRLEVQLRVANTGGGDLEFTAALHTYFRLADATTARLEGLRGVRYVSRGSSAPEVEAREAITAEAPIDRVYFKPPPVLRLEDASRAFGIEQRGFTDTVVWNPGREKNARMADMAPEGYRHMLCVEAAAIEPAVTLASGEAWSGAQAIRVS